MTQIGDSEERPDHQTYAIIGAAIEVHRSLDCGFLESVYQSALAVELGAREIPFVREFEIPVFYKGKPLIDRFRADFVCFGKVLVELKALNRLTTIEEAQIIHYLVATRLERGLLFNFGTRSLLITIRVIRVIGG
jgi:GxxExxY protein